MSRISNGFGTGSNSNGQFWYGSQTNFPGFLYKKNVGVGGRRSTLFAAGGNITCNHETYLYNKYKPGQNGIGASTIANRRAKNRLATVCTTQKCFPCYNSLGQYSNYTHNPNGYIPCPYYPYTPTSIPSPVPPTPIPPIRPTPIPNCSQIGGTVYQTNNTVIVVFDNYSNNNNSITFTQIVNNLNILVVGGGGAGGGIYYIQNDNSIIGTYNIIVGKGGNGNYGSDSNITFNNYSINYSITSLGGGVGSFVVAQGGNCNSNYNVGTAYNGGNGGQFIGVPQYYTDTLKGTNSAIPSSSILIPNNSSGTLLYLGGGGGGAAYWNYKRQSVNCGGAAGLGIGGQTGLLKQKNGNGISAINSFYNGGGFGGGGGGAINNYSGNGGGGVVIFWWELN